MNSKIELPPGSDPNNFNAGEQVSPEKFQAAKDIVRQRKKGGSLPIVDAEEVPEHTKEYEVQSPPAADISADPTAKETRILQPAPKAPVQMNDRGQTAISNLDELGRVVNALYKGKGFPNWVRSPEQAFAVAIFLRDVGLQIMSGIQHVCEVNGRLSLWGEGPLAAVRASGKLKSIKEGFYTSEYKEICFKNRNLDDPIHFAFCRTVRSDNGEVKETWFSEKDAATANKGLKEVWTGYRRTMFKRKARGENLKDNFGDILQGAGIAEYDDETSPDMPTTIGKIARPEAIPLAERVNQLNQIEDKNGEEATLQN